MAGAQEQEIFKATDDFEEEEDNETLCSVCGECPCEWIRYGELLIQSGEQQFPNVLREENVLQGDVHDAVQRRKARKFVYRLYVYNRYGHLGRGRRVKIPLCVRDRIRERWPEANAEDYMGHMSD